MRIATWNINSVRLRAPLALELLTLWQPDVLCLQETKTPDEFFPAQTFHDAGYAYQHIHGMKGYNGVAILSRIPFTAQDVHHRCGREDCRHIAVRLENGAEVHCLYVPAGGDIPDPQANDKFAHKLAFVEDMTTWFADRYAPADPLIIAGDFNIAPLENDVWSHKQLLDVVCHTPAETDRLNAMQGALSFTDAVRHFVPDDEKCYTWWSYRNRDWKKSNRGRRLDHIWVTPPLVPALEGQAVLQAARDWEKPSDHVPVCVDLAL